MDNVVPILTGERRDAAADYWHGRFLAMQGEWCEERKVRVKAEQVRDEYFDMLCEHADAIAEGRLIGPSAFWQRMVLCAVGFLLIGWLLRGVTL